MPTKAPSVRGLTCIAFLLNCLLAHGCASVEHEFVTRIGIPLPLQVYGYRLEESDRTRVLFLGHVSASYHVLPFANVPIGFGGWVAGTLMGAEEGSVSAWHGILASGPQVSGELTVVESASIALVLGLGVGVGLFYSEIDVDENLGKATYSLGARLHTSVGLAFCSQWAVALGVGLELLTSPLDGATWFNEELEESSYLHFTLGVRWRSSSGD